MITISDILDASRSSDFSSSLKSNLLIAFAHCLSEVGLSLIIFSNLSTSSIIFPPADVLLFALPIEVSTSVVNKI